MENKEIENKQKKSVIYIKIWSYFFSEIDFFKNRKYLFLTL